MKTRIAEKTKKIKYYCLDDIKELYPNLSLEGVNEQECVDIQKKILEIKGLKELTDKEFWDNGSNWELN